MKPSPPLISVVLEVRTKGLASHLPFKGSSLMLTIDKTLTEMEMNVGKCCINKSNEFYSKKLVGKKKKNNRFRGIWL